MKKIIVLLCILCSINAGAQKVNIIKDSTNYAYCRIQPTVARVGVIDSATRLCVTTFDDNQVDFTNIYYELKSETGRVLLRGNCNLQGGDYTEWSSVSFLYNYVANELNLHISE